MARARSIVLWVLTVEVVVLVVTGIALYFVYRPDAADAFSDVSASLSQEITFGSVIRDVHSWAAWMVVPTTIAAAVLLAVRSRPTERVGPGVAVGGGLFVAVVAATITGFLLPWDQIALFAVTVGVNMRGYTWLRNGDARFVIMDGTEIAPATLFKWLVLHAVALGGLVVGLLALAWRRARNGLGDSADVEGAVPPTPVEVPAGL